MIKEIEERERKVEGEKRKEEKEKLFVVVTST